MSIIKYLLERNYSIYHYQKGECVYEAGAIPKYVYFIKSGRISMVTVNAEGREFIQGIFKSGQYFGEPALLLQKRYLAHTLADQDTEIIVVNREQFLELLEEDRAFSMDLIHTLSNRLFYKSMMLEELANEQAAHRVATLIDYLLQDLQSGEVLRLTRQQLADMSGLRVETVIRTIRQLETEKRFRLLRGKIVKI
ncbi:Crp/Fnr family transcriptional regulator [Pedobacter sp. JY14-1]|uniref:Crp/Fnr family transcriptional regulator n=1 Tax=Pedobacter sp. JY14-1 TaxID=3034151 RepID=UPI0023E1DC6A|nr:Crp/Fnr family transcriptional regulator [Pedobacter sp. JY14-1]